MTVSEAQANAKALWPEHAELTGDAGGLGGWSRPSRSGVPEEFGQKGGDVSALAGPDRLWHRRRVWRGFFMGRNETLLLTYWLVSRSEQQACLGDFTAARKSHLACVWTLASPFIGSVTAGKVT